MITQQQLDGAMSYGQYRSLLEDLLAQGKTTGPHQNEDYLNYAKLNLQRMSRLEKTTFLDPELKEALSILKTDYIWLVLTEGWCADAAQNLPVIALMESECPHIYLKLLLRDENLEIMDQYLTGGSRSIPKLLCLERETYKEVFTWGPRPYQVQQLMLDLKRKETPPAEKSLQIQKWYNADKTETLQKEFAMLVKTHLK